MRLLLTTYVVKKIVYCLLSWDSKPQINTGTDDQEPSIYGKFK